jgi:hypothetical protein
MGKVINADISDEALVAQWIFRKLRNHHPMSERDSAKRHPLAREKNRQYQLSDTSNTVRYALNDGRVFEITVMKVEHALPAMVAEEA